VENFVANKQVCETLSRWHLYTLICTQGRTQGGGWG